ncbi:4-hydroxy-3-methylbut-2-en-1-yl diphosphate synthase [Ancylomarina euxinus]|uniref:4-hydroxy-3-methylbut-2-en-1-yl diphosphate synthase (flavodoxin) n=1 Tax=Ancylomarina euxinus TaxID=2283627 RepID=A0A425XZQ2_9BACT|nr:flavodoxin-dependent (E)-4-hydroxy-3-methylbut-2-enyl-diphosphate synthase [Ancylomarina euxinus]MCZ4695519.1 flavodoxin-dependent (E)-4-hydroxy-3-methylbut-2-enyl-diphosphate synthase [Ancylomarina euxinus]MUP15663.1 4-hydroxy-3-methylbut-2-en-1-yl diphosphate synthase [Ancylomarina euxinus]RRG20656.1 4-hydroxy-3-methylbut-2-en-1-yl diphosphate synthase [Ancylomarina euxinus]
MTISKLNTFCKDLFNYSRRLSSETKIGKTPLGALHPIRVQSMTNTDTNNVQASVEQAIRMIESGAEYVRLTTQGTREAENLKHIKAGLLEKGYQTPLVADIHFNPEAATIAAQYVDKIRVNPGNFVDKKADLKGTEYSEEMYQEGLNKIHAKFIPLINICKENKTAIRIGTNHGSLSDRIMSRYGDTPRGMVEATLEFLRICKDERFSNVAISIKSSNTVMMVKTVRLLVSEMNKEELYFPLHLGVTEAGEGEDGRIKSAVGTGALLNDGLGDTIRISLTEDPEIESPVGQKMVDYILEKENHGLIQSPAYSGINLCDFYKRSTLEVNNIGGRKQTIVISDFSLERHFSSDFPEQAGYKMNVDTFEWEKGDLAANYMYLNGFDPAIRDFPKELGLIVDQECWEDAFQYSELAQPLFSSEVFMHDDLSSFSSDIHFVNCEFSDLTDDFINKLKANPKAVIICQSKHQNAFAEQRAFVFKLIQFNCKTPVVFHRLFNENELEDLQLKSACDLGSLFIDGLGNGICLNNTGNISREDLNASAFGILQAARVRTSKTEFISCPGCGRTLFKLQDVVAEVKKKFAHLSHLKIGVMGCIVNGPGEMGDVDYGYVGAGAGRVSLYKSRELIKKNILSEDAIDELIQIIKENGDWKDAK